jgi:hypothetical protein
MSHFNQILRMLQVVIISIVLGICGGLLHQQEYGGTPSRLNYSIYAAVLAASTLVLYLIPSTIFPRISYPIITITMDTLNTLFLLCASIAMAASMGAHSCSDRRFLENNVIIERSSKRCHEANALTAFLWIATAVFAATMFRDTVS